MKYALTRHNVAWIILDTLLEDVDWVYSKYLQGEYYTTENRMYIQPQTFMNNSGTVLDYLRKEYDDFSPEKLIIIYDDIDLPLGKLRISFDRGDGGHNGVKSIIEHLGSSACIRIRVGVSQILADGRVVKPNVLGNFEDGELKIVKEDCAPRVQKILDHVIQHGYQDAMNRYNGE